MINFIDNIAFQKENFPVIFSSYMFLENEKKNKLYVSVKDYGIGIPKEELKLVWDRFYKSDASRGKDKKGTGLGLSITKEIIHSHGENINVISTLDAGSEFIFTLPIIDVEET